jgi:tetratricopeptide (TPR) repeat protein
LLYYAQGKYTEAEALYQRALKMREQVLGPQHPDVANSLNNLAWLYSALGKYAEAEPLYQRALKICEQVLGPDHPHSVTCRNNLAALRQVFP